ncbi:ABC transporter permease [Isoptericola sp. S6320L]|uniref:ABC transporter permease n=1 Tax=Isoptericola sp. S6320L TaxID=2926411 RepID=UPI001FF44930|nr:ABC transporter permease [Isoptericola sp. S6320L]MCK0116411.1 ABC transporter permease [Isoptericola sp. S6320L]
MTTTSTTLTAGGRTPRPTASRTRRLLALARAETLLLVRNRAALTNALLLPVGFVGLFGLLGGVGGDGASGADVAAAVLVMLLVVALIFVVYYNLTTAYVARREDRVLQRLLTGSTTRVEALLAPALPAVVVTLAQLVLGYVAVAVVIGPPGMTNPVLLLVAVLGGAAVLGALAAATAGFSRTVESVQLTTLPVIVLVLPFAGMFPTPDIGPLSTVARFTPLHPVSELVLLGLNGTDAAGRTLSFVETFGAAALPTAVLVGWTALGILAARRGMRWAPRR